MGPLPPGGRRPADDPKVFRVTRSEQRAAAMKVALDREAGREPDPRLVRIAQAKLRSADDRP
jgi:hypothetical protein